MTLRDHKIRIRAIKLFSRNNGKARNEVFATYFKIYNVGQKESRYLRGNIFG